MSYLLAIFVPYAAVTVFIIGISARILAWARSDVPFRIPTVCGQQKSLPWIRHAKLESPATSMGVLGRMALEVLLFRSLFRNHKVELNPGPRLAYVEAKLLWLGALIFHWSLLIIMLRHLRFVLNPVPRFVLLLQRLDGFFQIGTPILYLTDICFLTALVYLLLRRVGNRSMRYVSLLEDYVAPALLLGLALSGVCMRYFAKPDLVTIKEYVLGMVYFMPRLPSEAGPFFYAHLLCFSALLVYFPFGKLVHMAGVFLSPTRNLANNNRMKRHINAWNYPVKVHTYGEWENEFHDKIKAAGLPLERE